MNRALIEEPFEEDLIRTRKGSFGSELSYVEAVHYIRRLNDAFDGQWSFRIVGHENHGTELSVHAVLEAGGQVKHAYGGSQITTNNTTGEVISLAGDLKAAATDALKKACSLLGIGLELYSNKDQSNSRKPPLRAVRGNGRQQTKEQDPPRNRLTAKQLRAIYAIGHSQGISDAALKAECISKYDVAPEFLPKQDASAFIEHLNSDDHND